MMNSKSYVSNVKLDITVKLPDYETIVLSNGIKIFLMPVRDSLLSNIYLIIKHGVLDEPEDLNGLAQLTASMLKKGAGGLTNEDINFKADFYGINFHTFAQADYIGIESESLDEYLEHAWELVFASLTSPAFPDEEFIKHKKLKLDSINKTKENPSQIAVKGLIQQLFDRRYYGKPIEGKPEIINKIKIKDLKDYYNNFFDPRSMTLFLTGNFGDPFIERIKSDLEKIKWTKPLSKIEIPVHTNKKRIWIINKPDATQVQIKLGWHVCSHQSSDFYPLQMGTLVLGGGYSSRLMQEIRVNKGLSYGAYSRIHVYDKNNAILFIDTFTRPENVNEMFRVIENEIKKMSNAIINNDELISQQNYISGQYPLTFETNDDLINKLIKIELYDFSRRHIEDLPMLLKRSRPETIRDVFQKYIKWDEVTVSLVGPIELIKNQLPQNIQQSIIIKSVDDIINLT